MPRIEALISRINSYEKENLDEILQLVGDGLELISNCNRSRIYMEDLTEGLLVCVYARGENSTEIRGTSYFINPKLSAVPRAFIEKKALNMADLTRAEADLDVSFARKFNIRSSFIAPILKRDRAVGLACLDGSDDRENCSDKQRLLLSSFLNRIAHTLEYASKYHQQICLARQVDQVKKREAAFLMLRSAVKLIDKLTLASVLVPAESVMNSITSDSMQKALSASEKASYMNVLACYTRDIGLRVLYEENSNVSLAEGRSLVSQIIDHDRRKEGLFCFPDTKPFYVEDVKKGVFQRRELAEKVGLCSLYMVPRFEPENNRLVCIVNYYTNQPYEFSEFEKNLLESHADRVEKILDEVGSEHIEIRVLSEINELLSEKNVDLQSFLMKVLTKAAELIGADVGSVALVREINGEKWLVTDDEDSKPVGAKTKEGKRRTIPPLKIGGMELKEEERSFTGYVAHVKEGLICSKTKEAPFYKELFSDVKSELVVPMLFDEEVIGVINLESGLEDYFTEDHKRILEIISRLVSRQVFDLIKIEELQKEVNRLKRDIAYRDPAVSSYKLGNIIGNSLKSKEIINLINLFAQHLYNRISSWERETKKEPLIGLPSILITGETGSGKEFIFNHIYSRLNELHLNFKQVADELPLKKTNIAAYSGELTYSELFGHKKGAFTGAHADRIGILEEANGGVVFLDEIGDADPKTQVQLLRFLDNGDFVRLGENKTRYARVLLVAATNKDLKKEIQRGTFREDLYHRLSELTIDIPSLNERREDIPDLATHFLGKLYQTYRGEKDSEQDGPFLDEEAKSVLVRHQFRGNVRELRSILLLALFSRSGRRLGKGDIERAIAAKGYGQVSKTSLQLNEQLSSEIYENLIRGEKDFWELVYKPFSENLISREVVKLIVSLARQNNGDSLSTVAQKLKVYQGDLGASPEEEKKFVRFKNFLYKTIRITQL